MNPDSKTWLVSALVIILLAGCTPSEREIQTAVAQTLAAGPTAASLPTEIPTSTASALPTATAMSAKATPAGATPAPPPKTDLQVIDVNPRNLILTKQDMPADGRYFLPVGSTYGPVTNSEVVSGMAEERRKMYLANSGRIYGWETELQRGSSSFAGPLDVWNQVVIYETSADASGAVAADADCTRLEGFEPATEGFNIGDVSVICRREANGNLAYWLAFAHRNLVAVMEGSGGMANTDLAFFQALAEKQLAIFEAQPLSAAVTFAP